MCRTLLGVSEVEEVSPLRSDGESKGRLRLPKKSQVIGLAR
jgi:hypothetical protein